MGVGGGDRHFSNDVPLSDYAILRAAYKRIDVDRERLKGFVEY